MVFQADLYTYLHANAGLTALIGARLYPNDAPPDVVVPFVVYYEFATPREQLMSCAVAISKPRIQYSTPAPTRTLWPSLTPCAPLSPPPPTSSFTRTSAAART
jgi:hypothetical protein